MNPKDSTRSMHFVARLSMARRFAIETLNPCAAGPVMGASVLAVAALFLTFFSLSTPAAASEACANEARREEQGERALALPDCRAYELVSPLRSEPEAAIAHITPVSLTGERIGYYTQFGPPPGFPGAGAGPYYLSTRGPDGWTTADEVPPQSTSSGLFCSARVAGYSADLSRAVLADGWNWSGYPQRPDDTGTTASCGHGEPLLDPDEGQGAQNIFLHQTDAPNETGFYELLNPTPSGLDARDAYFQAGSADFSHIVFTSPLQLTPGAPLPPEQTGQHSVGEDLYESTGGAVHLVTVLPGGVPDWGILANGWESDEAPTSASFTHAVSEDGERVYFYGNGEQYCETPLGGAGGTLCGTAQGAYLGANLYLRQNVAQEPGGGGECSPGEAGRACTIQVDKPNSDAPPGSGGGGVFQWATPAGSRAFFTDCARLTADATAVSSPAGCGGFAKTENGYEQPSGNDLYEWDAEKPVGVRLTDLTVDPNGSDPLGADVQGVAGISADGSYVYFVARGILTGSEENARHEKAAAGEANLYLRHGGTTTFIAILGPPSAGEFDHEGVRDQVEACDWASAKTPEWSPGADVRGQPFACLTSRVSADGRFLAFDSHRSLTGYDNTIAATGEPSFEIFRYDAATSGLSCASCDPTGNPPIASATYEQPSILPPLLTGERWGFGAEMLSSQLADDGRVFFSTTDALLPADKNIRSDVYEYDGGNLHLISAGTGDDDSLLRNASPSGDDVFFTTADPLVRADTDGAISLYDARAGGGFPEPPAAPGCESEEACHAARQQTPAASSSDTSRFQGPEEDAAHPICAKGQVKKKGNCVKKSHKKSKKKSHKKHSKKKKGKANARHARSDRRVGR